MINHMTLQVIADMLCEVIPHMENGNGNGN